MVKTGQFTTKCKGDRAIVLKWQNHFGVTPPKTLSTPLQATSCDR